MKKLVFILGAIGLIAISVGVYFYISISNQLEPAVKVTNSFIADVKSGDTTSAAALMSTEEQALVGSDKLAQLTDFFKSSGTYSISNKLLETTNGSQFAVLIGKFSTPTAADQAYLRVILVKSGNDWQVNSLHTGATESELDVSSKPSPSPTI